MKKLYKALADFQKEVPVILKTTAGFGYKYAELSTITEIINPILAKHGLGYTQPLAGKAVKTILFHIESGESIESTVEIPQDVKLKGMNDFQALGSGITYLRRYSLSSVLGLITDADNDGAGQQVVTNRDVQSEINNAKDNVELTALWHSLNAKEQKEFTEAFKTKKATFTAK